MPFYVSSYIGSGTATDRFRPRGSDQPGWAAIDLRADGGATVSGGGLPYCLLWLPLADSDPALYKIADGKGEELPLQVRAGIAARLNATINYTRFDDIVAELLLRPPANAWKPLRDHPTAPLAIHLNGLLSPSPSLRALAAQTYNETWTAADSSSPTADLTWTEHTGTGLGITSNRLRCTGVTTGEQHARAQHDLDSSDMIVKMTLETMTATTSTVAIGVTARADGGASPTSYFYGPNVESGGASAHFLTKFVTGSETVLGTNATDFAAGEIVELHVDGSTVQGWRNGVLLNGPTTDTAIPSGTRAGVRAYQTASGDLTEGDNWQARDYIPRPLVTVATALRW